MLELNENQRLHCSCDSEEFIEKYHIKLLLGGGSVKEPAGFICNRCKQTVNLAQLLSLELLRRKEVELVQAQKEVESLRPKPKTETEESQSAETGKKKTVLERIVGA